MLEKLLNPCYMFSESNPTHITIWGLLFCLSLIICLLTGKTVGATKYHDLGRIMYRDEEPFDYWLTMLVLALSGLYCLYPLLGCA